jgi:hypothetical protein
MSASDMQAANNSNIQRDDGPAATKARRLYTYAEARRKARTYGFTTRNEFVEYECAGAYQLPKNADEVWAEDWSDWDDFLGVPLSFDVARDVVRTANGEGGTGMVVKSDETYMEWLKSEAVSDDDLASRLPMRPDLYYKTQWVSWEDFLGV